MDQQVETETLFTSFDSARYLGISLKLFCSYVGDGLICYRLINLQRRFKKEELDRFKREVLKKT